MIDVRMISRYSTAVFELDDIPLSTTLRSRTTDDLARDIFHVVKTGTKPPGLSLFTPRMDWPHRTYSLYESAKHLDVPDARWLITIHRFLNANGVKYIPATHAGRMTAKQYIEVVDPGMADPYLAYEIHPMGGNVDDPVTRLVKVFGERLPLAKFPSVYTEGLRENLTYFGEKNLPVYHTLVKTLTPLTVGNKFHRLVVTLGLILVSRQTLPWAKDRDMNKTYDVLDKNNPSKWMVAFVFKMFWLKNKSTDADYKPVEMAMIREGQYFDSHCRATKDMPQPRHQAWFVYA